MNYHDRSFDSERTPHGQIGYVQIPAADVAQSAAFYETVFGWSTERTYGSFEAPGMIGQVTTDRNPTATGGPVLWISVSELLPALADVVASGGSVHGRPALDNGERWLVEVDDPAGNRIGIVVPARRAQPQTMIAVLQLHQRDTAHHHGQIGDPTREVGNGVLLWFGEVSAFDDVVTRAEQLGAPVVRPPHRNPPEGEGNGPGHREIWINDLDGYTVVIASPDGEAYEPN